MKKLYFLLFVCLLSCARVADMEIFDASKYQDVDFRGMKIFAHRGYWDTPGSYENTLTSISKAAEIGVHGVELDVRISKDSILYLHHNVKVFNGTKLFNMTSAEVDEIILPNGDQIPKIEDVLVLLKKYPDMLVNLELKSDVPTGFYTTVVKKLNDAVMQSAMSDRVFFSSFSQSMLTKSKNYNPLIKTYFLPPAEFQIEKAIDSKIDMIFYDPNSLIARPDFVTFANTHNIEFCTGFDKVEDVVKVLGYGLNFKYCNTNEPDKVMQIYKNR